MINDEIMTAILSGYALPFTGIHGPRHWGRVLENGLRLAALTGADTKVVELFAVFHDARRENEGTDPHHGRRGAELAGRLRPQLDLTDGQFEQLEYACIHHTEGLRQGQPTVQTCWDADRLDLWRAWIVPQAQRLCTEAAQDEDILAWSRVRSKGDFEPECSVKWMALAGEDR